MQQKPPKKGQKVRVTVNGALAPCMGKVLAVQGNWALVAFNGPQGQRIIRYNWCNSPQGPYVILAQR